MNAKFSQPRFQRGIALVETAICLPVLLLVMLAAGELTNAFLQHNTLTKSVRDGARYVSGEVVNHSFGVDVFDLNAQLVQDTKNLVVYGNTSGTGAPILPNLTAADVTVSDLGGAIVEVRAAYAYTGITGSVIPA
ncbi:MAG TPA: TadE family protein, partial [Woeseiaceae bacterium]|nr:TadE family protein [Woeseiaceae bacterium]